MESWHRLRLVDVILLEANTELCRSVTTPAKYLVLVGYYEDVIATASNLRDLVRQSNLLEEHLVVKTKNFLLVIVISRHLAVPGITDVEDVALVSQHHRTQRHACNLLDLCRQLDLRLVCLDSAYSII